MRFQNSKAGEGNLFLSSGLGDHSGEVSYSNVEIQTPKTDVKVRDPSDHSAVPLLVQMDQKML